MFDHITVHVSDIEKSKAFYTAMLKPLGYIMTKEYPEWKLAAFGTKTKPMLWVHADGAKQQAHIALTAKTPAQVQAFYKAAIKAGGKDNGKPGFRKDYNPGYYAAFAHDLDRHNIEAVLRDKSKMKAKPKTVVTKKGKK